jgi:transposase-like protein
MGTTEVPEKARRRTFDRAYRLRIVEEADGCTEPGQIGELLRRESLYSSQLSNWRRQRVEGSLSETNSKKRGRKPKKRDSAQEELEQLRREKEALAERLRQAEVIIEVQKKSRICLGFARARPTTRTTDDRS